MLQSALDLRSLDQRVPLRRLTTRCFPPSVEGLLPSTPRRSARELFDIYSLTLQSWEALEASQSSLRRRSLARMHRTAAWLHARAATRSLTHVLHHAGTNNSSFNRRKKGIAKVKKEKIRVVRKAKGKLQASCCRRQQRAHRRTAGRRKAHNDRHAQTSLSPCLPPAAEA